MQQVKKRKKKRKVHLKIKIVIAPVLKIKTVHQVMKTKVAVEKAMEVGKLMVEK